MFLRFRGNFYAEIFCMFKNTNGMFLVNDFFSEIH